MNRLGFLPAGIASFALLSCNAASSNAGDHPSGSASDEGQTHAATDAAAADPSTTSDRSDTNSDSDDDSPPSDEDPVATSDDREPVDGSANSDDDSPSAGPRDTDDEPDSRADDDSPDESDDEGDDRSPTPDDDTSDDPTDNDAADDDAAGDDATAEPPPDDTPPTNALGAFPFEDSAVTRGGTMTFTNVGAPGWWPRRVHRSSGSECGYKDGSDTWGGDCCMEEHHTSSDALSPFDEEMTLIVKTIDIKQLAIYQPENNDAQSGWRRVSDWDRRSEQSNNLWFTQEGRGSTNFPGDLTKNDCVGYVMQEPLLDCEDVSEYFCPDDPGILHQGYAGSKLIVFLGSMLVDDSVVESCSGDGSGHPGPWVAMVASELVRDGGRKWNGACNCYSKTGSVGDGCGEINVFEVVMDGNEYSNREFASTGVRSYQAGHVGGAVCTADCERDAFPSDVEVIDACAGDAYATGPELEMGGATDGCPVWRRPNGDRYFFILFDETRRSIQVGVLHPANLPASISGVLPELHAELHRRDIDALLELRLPAE